jgi:8-oxo-dGTP pyrophosphatase MutT (NUDIX family)
MISPFERTDSRVVLKTPIFDLREGDAIHPRTGIRRTYYVLQTPAYVNVVALTTEARIVLVRQWRHGTRDIGLELPAGLVDPGEAPETAAARGLLEETGYVAARLTLIGQVQPNPAHQDNVLYTVLAEGCVPGPEGMRLDDGEDIEVVIADPAELPNLVRSGQVRSAMVVCGIFWWLDRRGAIAWESAVSTPSR